MVREYAKKNASRGAFLQWEADGYLEFCEGTIDTRQIRGVLDEIHAQTPIQEFRYDPNYALEFSENLSDETGIVVVPFPQTIMYYAKPVDDFEAGVIAHGKDKIHTIHHDGNPVYQWEIGHANIRKDANNNRRVVKPSDDDYRKVDIVQAGIMSLSGAMASDSGYSVYETNGIMSVRA
jgi:phage terminase large subunit-like protein